MNIYKCDKYKKMTVIDDKYYLQILCENCKNELKDIKWTENIGKELIKEVKYKKISHFNNMLKTNNSSQYTDKQYEDDLNKWFNEIKYTFKIFYQHDLTTYSTIIVEQKHNISNKAVNLFTTKYPYDKNTKFIHIIEYDTFNKPLHYDVIEHRTISKKSRTIHKNHPIERFYYYYPQLAQNYLVQFIKDQKVYIKYFNNIYEAYQLMKYEFYKFCNREGGSIAGDCITFQHEVAFGGITAKMIENTDDTFYSQNPIKSKEEIEKLVKNKHLSEDLTFNLMDSLVPDEFYFDIKLIHNNKMKDTCIICGHNKVAGYNDVIVYNSNYVNYYYLNVIHLPFLL